MARRAVAGRSRGKMAGNARTTCTNSSEVKSDDQEYKI